MRLLRSIPLALAILLAAGSAAAAEKTVTAKVKGWTCGACVDKTETAVKKLDGVKSVSGDEDAGTLKITFDDAKVDLKKIETAVASAGFKCEAPK